MDYFCTILDECDPPPKAMRRSQANPRPILNSVLQQFWAVRIKNCEELAGVDWQWQSADAAMSKARFGGIMSS